MVDANSTASPVRPLTHVSLLGFSAITIPRQALLPDSSFSPFVHFHDRNQPVLGSASPPYGEFILLSIPLLHRTAFYDLNVHFYYIPARAVLVIKSVSALKINMNGM